MLSTVSGNGRVFSGRQNLSQGFELSSMLLNNAFLNIVILHSSMMTYVEVVIMVSFVGST